jgi:16S rRNA C967 or C1407 C5-methylase (RsmB/RsmF family)
MNDHEMMPCSLPLDEKCDETKDVDLLDRNAYDGGVGGDLFCSLDEYRVHISESVKMHLAQSLGMDHVEEILDAMKRPLDCMTCRVAVLAVPTSEKRKDRDHQRTQIMEKLRNHWNEKWIRERLDTGDDNSSVQILIDPHSVLPDVIVVRVAINNDHTHHDRHDQHPMKARLDMTIDSPSSNHCTDAVAPNISDCDSGRDAGDELNFRAASCISDYKMVLVDRFCGEAVLSGADVYKRGVLGSDAGIGVGDQVAVYAILVKFDSKSNDKNLMPLIRGFKLEPFLRSCMNPNDLENGNNVQCVFVGTGIAQCSRSAIFREQRGVAVAMDLAKRNIPCLPPFDEDILSPWVVLQHPPSIVVGHALKQSFDMDDPTTTIQAKAPSYILDMCAAPGGKSSHLASLFPDTKILACDKSRSKMRQCYQRFLKLGIASNVLPLVMDSSKCVLSDSPESGSTVHKILDAADCQDGIFRVHGFVPESFEAIILDPPCSALGLRPKLQISASLEDLQSAAQYQRKFVDNAVQLLKPGGVLLYSTCTINPLENEGMVRYILDKNDDEIGLELLDVGVDLGCRGLVGHELLSETEHRLVRRFDPTKDTMGFFIAKFQKRIILEHLS